MDNYQGKELIETYEEKGFIVKIYRPIMTDKERQNKKAQIKYDILNTIKSSQLRKDKLKPI